jgi:hypothetical protein
MNWYEFLIAFLIIEACYWIYNSREPSHMINTYLLDRKDAAKLKRHGCVVTQTGQTNDPDVVVYRVELPFKLI